jgi:methanogenic corrinoid protein MtbC1
VAPLRSDTERLRRSYLTALLNGESREARTLIEEAARAGMPVATLYLEVLQPALHEVGDRWERGEIGVAQEHLATAVTSAVLAALSPGLGPAGGAAGRAVVSCTPGEQHVIGGRMVSDFLAADGWDVEHLTEPLPVDELVELVQATDTTLVGLSTSLPWLLPEARRVCVALKALPRPPRVIVGGRAYRGDPHMAELVGADSFAADPRQLLSRLAEVRAR